MLFRSLRKAGKYKRIGTVLVEGEAHLKDPLMPPPKILKPPTTTKEPSPDDVTDFPAYKTIPIPESISYREGKYRPPSIPFITGWFPYNTYLQQGKVYSWCACGMSQTNPSCDGTCNSAVTRCRPIQFNVSESGYYKLCNCKNSANAPFCNGTHRDLIKFHHKTHRGFYEIYAYNSFWLGFLYMYWNWYT